MAGSIIGGESSMIIPLVLGMVSFGFNSTVEAQGQRDEKVCAFEHVSVLTMTSDTVLSDHTVVSSGDRITSVGPTANAVVPDGAVRIDGRGKYLIPGLADMHVHLYDINDLKLMLANGVTTVLNMSGSPQVLAWREEVSKGTLLAPTIFTTGPMLRLEYAAPLDSQAIVKTSADAAPLIAEHSASGYDFVKIWSSFPIDTYDAIISAARANDIPVTGHIPRSVGLEHALASGQTSIAHVEEFWNKCFRRQFSDAKLADVVRQAKDARANVITTLVTYEAIIGAGDENNKALLSRPERSLVDPVRQMTWRSKFNRLRAQATGKTEYFRSSLMHMQRIVRGLNDNGVRLLAGTDAGEIPGLVPGAELHRELELLVASGMTSYEALSAATRNPGDYLKNGLKFGRISTGCQADLVLLDNNPLTAISNTRSIAGVMVRGTWLPKSALDSMIEQLQVNYRRSAVFVDKVMRGGVKAGTKYYVEQKHSDPDAMVLLETPTAMLALLLLKQRKVDDALEILQLIAKEYPESYLPHYVMTRVLIDENRKGEGASALAELLDRYPSHPEADRLRKLLSAS